MVEAASKPKSRQTAALEAVLDYHQRGWAVTDLDYRSKAIREPNWPHLELDEDKLRERLAYGPQNIAVILGDRSNGLIDIDLDSPEALCSASAPVRQIGDIEQERISGSS